MTAPQSTFVLDIAPDANWRPSPEFDAESVHDGYEANNRFAFVDVLSASERTRLQECAKIGETWVTADNLPSRTQHRVCHCRSCSCRWDASRLAATTIQDWDDALVQAHRATGRSVRTHRFLATGIQFARPLNLPCDRAAARPGRRPCGSNDELCTSCSAARPWYTAYDDSATETIAAVRRIISCPGLIAALRCDPVPGQAALLIWVMELEDMGIVGEDLDDDGWIGRRVQLPLRDLKATEQEWIADCTAKGLIGTYATFLDHDEKAIRERLVEIHMPVVETIDDMYRAGRLTPCEVVAELVRLDAGRETKSETGKIEWRRLQRNRWLGELARHHQKSLDALRVERVDQGPRRLWKKTSTWECVRRRPGGSVDVRDIFTRHVATIDLTGREAMITRRGIVVLCELRQRFRAKRSHDVGPPSSAPGPIYVAPHPVTFANARVTT
jgi:hypothetical protein